MCLVLAKGKNDLTLDPLQSLYMYFSQHVSQTQAAQGMYMLGILEWEGEEEEGEPALPIASEQW